MNRPLTESQFVEQLALLGAEVQFPATPDIAGEIANRIKQKSRHTHRIWYAYGVVALVLILAATPPVRAAVLQAFDAIGIDVRIGDRSESDMRLEVLDAAAFGEPVTMAEAEEAFGRPLTYPTAVLPADPDAVYLYQHSTTGLTSVTFVYAATDDLPALPDSNIGAILTQITGPRDTPYLVKTALPTSSSEVVSTVFGPAQWVEDGQLEVLPVGMSRYSAHVLVWLDGTTAYRLESMLDQSGSIQIAESMELAPGGNHLVPRVVWGSDVRRTRTGG